MIKKKIIKDITRLQILTARYIERHSDIRFVSSDDYKNILLNSKASCTYAEAVENLIKTALPHMKNAKLLNEIYNLKTEIESSDIKNYRLGNDIKNNLSLEESGLEIYREKQMMFYNEEMNSIKDTCRVLKINEITMKRACQEERLMNTRKIGTGWLVNLRECMDYWNKEL